MKKIIKLTLAVIFLLFAVLQYNDPDPLLWMVIYGFTAIMLMLPINTVVMRRVLLGAILLGSAYACFYLPGVYQWVASGDFGSIAESMKTDKMYIEETREFFGLLIAILALLYHYRSLPKA